MIGMQERADISNTHEVFLLIKFLVKESLRCMVSTHTDCSTFTKPTAHTGTWLPVLMWCGWEQKVNKGSYWKSNKQNKKHFSYICLWSYFGFTYFRSWILPAWPTLYLALHLKIKMIEISNTHALPRPASIITIWILLPTSRLPLLLEF